MTEERVNRGRPPWWFIAGALAVVAVTISGNLYSGWIGREATTTTTRREPSLSALVADAEAVVLADVTAVGRKGAPKEPTVVASIRVGERLRGRLAAGRTVRVSDAGFAVPWTVGDRVLLFLRIAEGLDADLAPWRVAGRFGYDKGRLVAPFTEADVRTASS